MIAKKRKVGIGARFTFALWHVTIYFFVSLWWTGRGRLKIFITNNKNSYSDKNYYITKISKMQLYHTVVDYVKYNRLQQSMLKRVTNGTQN